MQIALKSLPSLDDADIDKMITETMRLQLAGIDSFVWEYIKKCLSVESSSMVDEIAEKVIEKIKDMSIDSDGGGDVGKQEGRRGTFANRPYRPRVGNPRNRTSQRGRKCRTCESPEHFF